MMVNGWEAVPEALLSWLNCEVEDCDTCNLSTNNLWINEAGFVYTAMFQPASQTAQRNAAACQDSLPQFIWLLPLEFFFHTHLCYSTSCQCNVSSLFLRMIFDLLVLFSRNSRMWTGRSTTQTCPPWPHRPPRAARTFTSCRSQRSPCPSQSSLLDQVSHLYVTPWQA